MSAFEPLPVETAALIVRAGSGDRRATERLIVCYQQRIGRFVVAQTGDRSHYEDLCQTIFVKMVLGLPKLRDCERFEPWLFQIARNVCRDHLRARAGWRRLFVPYTPSHGGLAETASHSDNAPALDAHIEKLPAAQRTLLRLSLDEPRSYEELARLSGSSVPAVKSRLHRARQALRSMMLTGEVE